MKTKGCAITTGHANLIADLYVAQKCEMRISMGGVDRGATLARFGRSRDMPRSERKRLPAATVKRDYALAKPRHLDAGHWPSISPGPGLYDLAGGSARGKGAFKQDLGEQRLGMDPQALAEQYQSKRGKKGGRRGVDGTRRPPRCRLEGKGHCRHRLLTSPSGGADGGSRGE
jgi:hypothetical protein